MNKKIIFFIIIIFIVKISCLDYHKPIAINSNRDSLVYYFNVNDNYFTRFVFQTTGYPLDFNCMSNSTVRICSAIVDNENAKKFVGGVRVAIKKPSGEVDEFSWYLNDYPIPIIDPEFKPSTKYGKEQIQGYYMNFNGAFFTLFPSIPMPVVGNFDNAMNRTIEYPGGCGSNLIIWDYNRNYTFYHQNPSIYKIKLDQSIMVIEGDNFCNITERISISINTLNVIKSYISLVSHEMIKINITEIYPRNITVKINAGGLDSNEYKYQLKPVIYSVNSVPKNKGGLVIFNGERLESSNKSRAIIKIGNRDCINSRSTGPNLLICEIGVLEGNGQSTGLQIIISIDGIENENPSSLLFSYDKVFISPNYTLPNGFLKLSGNCLGNNETTLVYIGGNKSNYNIDINSEETTLMFKSILGPIKSDLYLVVGGIKSNVIPIDTSFYVTFSDNTPSVNGQTIVYTIYHINSNNFKSIPSINLINIDNTTPITGIKSNTSADQTIQYYSFEIPKGCGKRQVKVIMGDQSCETEFNYESPTITNCTVDLNNKIVCSGDFGEFQNNFKNKEAQIHFSNEIIDKFDYNSTAVTFALIDKYHSSGVSIQMCGLQSTSYMLNISPSFTNLNSSLFNTVGGNITIIGKYLNEDSSNNTFFICSRNQETTNLPRVNCTLGATNTHMICNFDVIGPYDLKCNLTFNGINDSADYNNSYTFGYCAPVILDSNKINPTKGGYITIIGDEFYDPIEKVTIGNKTCLNATFIDSKKLTCELNPIPNAVMPYEDLYVNITINGKSNGTCLPIFENKQPESSHNNDGNSGGMGSENNQIDNKNDNKNGGFDKRKLKWILPVAIITPFLIALSIYVGKKKYINYKRRKVHRDIELKNQKKMDDGLSNFKRMRDLINARRISNNRNNINTINT